MVVIKVVPRVHQWRKPGNTGGLQPTDVGAELIADGLEHGSANWAQGVRHGLQCRYGVFRYSGPNAKRAARAGVAFDRCRLGLYSRFNRGEIGLAANGTGLFGRPADEPDGSSRVQIKLPQYVDDRRSGYHTHAVVRCTGRQVPAVQVTRDDHELTRFFTAGPIGNDIAAVSVWQCSWRKHQ